MLNILNISQIDPQHSLSKQRVSIHAPDMWKDIINDLQWKVSWTCPGSMSGILLLSREFPQDNIARRMRSLPHILILSCAWTTHTAASSTTMTDTKHLAADIVWLLLLLGWSEWTIRWAVRMRVKRAIKLCDNLWGELEEVYIVNVCYPERWFLKCWGHRVF